MHGDPEVSKGLLCGHHDIRFTITVNLEINYHYKYFRNQWQLLL